MSIEELTERPIDVVRVLSQHAALGALDSNTLRTLAARATIVRLDRRALLWNSGDEAEEVCIVARGLVKVFVPAQGPGLVFGVYGPSEHVEDGASLAGGRRGTSAAALCGNAAVLRLPLEAVRAALQTSGRATLAWNAQQAAYAVQLRERLVRVSWPAEARLASALLELGERYGDELEDGSVLIPLHLSRIDLAAMIGTTAETVVRTLTRWSRSALVQTQGRSMVLSAPVALGEFVSRMQNGEVSTEPLLAVAH